MGEFFKELILNKYIKLNLDSKIPVLAMGLNH